MFSTWLNSGSNRFENHRNNMLTPPLCSCYEGLTTLVFFSTGWKKTRKNAQTMKVTSRLPGLTHGVKAPSFNASTPRRCQRKPLTEGIWKLTLVPWCVATYKTFTSGTCVHVSDAFRLFHPEIYAHKSLEGFLLRNHKHVPSLKIELWCSLHLLHEDLRYLTAVITSIKCFQCFAWLYTYINGTIYFVGCFVYLYPSSPDSWHFRGGCGQTYQLPESKYTKLLAKLYDGQMVKPPEVLYLSATRAIRLCPCFLTP